MILLAGLGNPGKEYDGTRHNMGYMAIDALADDLSVDFSRHGFSGVYGILKDDRLDDDVLLLKPETFMNLSGDSVVAAISFYKIDIDDVIVIYDDMAIAPGHIRLRKEGSSGGHKGMEDIIRKTGTQSIKRIRIGIGEPQSDPVSYVLGKAKGEEGEALLQGIDLAKKALKECLLHGFESAMNRYNR